jgi:hypothetical protein
MPVEIRQERKMSAFSPKCVQNHPALLPALPYLGFIQPLLSTPSLHSAKHALSIHTLLVSMRMIILEVPKLASRHQGRAMVLGKKPPPHV